MKQVCGKNCANAMYKDGDPNTYCSITDTECFDCKDMMNMFEEIPKDFLGIPGKEVEVRRE